jgi:hypothetical protein
MPVHAAARIKPVVTPLLLASLALLSALELVPSAPAVAPAIIQPRPPVTHYYSGTIDEVNLFCRKAGPAVLLLHRFPASSDLFHDLIPILAKPEPHGAKICATWAMDHGAPAGYRLALKRPGRTVSTV